MRTRNLATMTFIWVLVANCHSVKTYPVNEPGRDASEYVSEGVHAMVASSHPDATHAGLSMLKMGGNAIDAAAAVSFAISVVRPHSTGIGGGGFLLYYDKQSQQTSAYDFRERAPASATKTMFLNKDGSIKSFKYNGKVLPNASISGHLASGIPGLIKGIIEIHQRYGKLPLKTVIEPAIQLAEKGFPVYRDLEAALVDKAHLLSTFPGSAKIFLKPDGTPFKQGELLIQKDLAETLRLIAQHGAAIFYEGEIAKKLVAEMRRGKGILSAADLKEYTVKKRSPVIGTYRGYKIVSMPPPSSGGVHIVQMLNMLEPYNLNKLGHHSVASLHLITEVMRRAFADRAQFMGDPDFVSIPMDKLLSKSYARHRMKGFDPKRASPSKSLKWGEPLTYESDSTTHFSIVDRDGNAVSSTQTINGWFGSGVVAQGTGIVLNNEMDDFSIKLGVPNLFGLVGSEANAVAARKTMLSSMSPTIVFDESGRLDLVTGSPGGPRIINATFQTIINRIDYKMPMDKTVFAFRSHHQWLPDVLYIEKDAIDKAKFSTLKAMGHDMQEYGSIGNVQAIGRVPNGKWIGVADSRDNGLAAGF